MNCPNINIKSVRDEFNDIIAAFGGQAMTIEEFRSKDVRNMRSGVDNSAMQIAYYVWDKTNGEGLAALPEYVNSAEIDDMQRIRNIVNNMLGIKKGGVSSPIVNAEIKAISLLQSESADKMFKKGSKNGWTLDKTLNEIGGFAGYKQLFNPEDLSKKVSELDREQLAIDIASKYGYSVEINTARQQSGFNSLKNKEVITQEEYDALPYEEYNLGSNDNPVLQKESPNGSKYIHDEDGYHKYEIRENESTQYYSNITVPGGTNYTENEISTPLITPTIKGHAQFSTDQGIGWFRSDEQVIGGKEVPANYEQSEADIEEGIPPYAIGTKTEGGTPTKTRRILEMQSDLFQKGRGKEDLTSKTKLGGTYKVGSNPYGNKNEFPYAIFDNTGEIWEFYKTKKEADAVLYNQELNTNPDNQFLQLLNKDNNWVTFFIKAIIQDSAKKGYEKVLFPKGETASKIEGHETIAEEIIRKDNELNLAIKQKEKLQIRSFKDGYKLYVGEVPQFDFFKNKIDAEEGLNAKQEVYNNDIKRLEQEKANLKSQGVEKLKPIEAFYEIKVGNVLEKQFGKDNVKAITDEYGNEWREVSISPADLDVIKFEKEDVVENPLSTVKSRAEIYEEEMSRYNKGMDSVRRRHGLSDGETIVITPALFSRLTKIYTNGDYPFMFEDTGARRTDMDYYGQRDFIVRLKLKPEYEANLNKLVERLYLSQFPDGKAPEIEAIPRDEMLKIAFDDHNDQDNASETQIQPRRGTQLNMLDDLFKFKSNEPGRPSKQAVRALSKLADRLYERFGIRYQVVSSEEASSIASMISGRNYNISETTKGFYVSSAKTAYLVLDRFDSNTTVHEVFGHPFLDVLKATPELRPLYNKLAIEAALDNESVIDVNRLYSDQMESIKADEVILRSMKKYIDAEAQSSSIRKAINEFYEFITSILNKIFGKSNLIKSIRPDATLESMARWAMYGTDKVSLVGGSQGQLMQGSIDLILNKFNRVEYSDSERSIVSFRDMESISLSNMLSQASEEESELILSTIDEVGFVSVEHTIENIKARLNSTNFSKSNIRKQDGSVAATFEWRTDGRIVYVDSINPIGNTTDTSIVISILNAIKDRPESRIAMMYSGKNVSIYKSLSNLMAFPSISNSVIKIDGVDHIVIDKNLSSYSGDIAFERSHVSNDELSTEEIREFIKSTSDGLKSQLREMERKGSSSISEMERVKSVINDIENLDEVDGIMSFLDHAGKEISIASKRIYALRDSMLLNEVIDQSELHHIKTNFFSLYKHAIRAISSIRIGTNVISRLPMSDQERFDAAIQYVSDRMIDVELNIEKLSRYAYANEMAKIGIKSGSTTINSSISQIYNESSDISTIGAFIFGLSKSSKEPLRALSKIVGDVKSEVAIEMEIGEFGKIFNELTDIWKKIKSKNRLANYDRIMEKADGKYTGFLISDLLYGKFRHEYKKFRENLQVKYRLRNQNDRPIDKAEYYAYMDELNEWLSDHAERRFKPEYYKARAKLSIEAREILDAANDAISSFLKRNDLIDSKGRPATEKMTEQQKKIYKDLKNAKKAISMLRNPDGTPKLEGSDAWNIANEISAFNEEIASNVKYRANIDAFNEKYDEMKASLTPDKLKAWENDNLKVQYKQEFWDSIEKADISNQTAQWQNAYNERAAILKMYRDSDTLEVSADELDSIEYISPSTGNITTLGDRLRQLDVWLSNNKVKSKKTASSFSGIAETVPTLEYKAMEREALDSNDPGVYEEFVRKTSYSSKNGKLIRYSQYSKIEPIDKSLIEIVPNSMWSELDPESAYVNPEYSESLAEDGMQPKRSMYDNSSAYNEAISDPDWKLFRDKIRDAYKIANSKYTYLHNPNSLQLAQIPGGFLRRAFAYDNILKGIGTAIADNFIVRSYDVGFGDYESRGAFRADGSPTMFVPTRYRTLLDNPNTISRDILGSLALYAKSAINYNLMTKKESAISTLLDGIANTAVKGTKAGKAVFVRPGETKMYKAAKEYVESNVYDRSSNPYDIFIPSKKNPDYQYRIAASKPIIKFLNYVRKVNLSFNIRAILTNWIGAELHMKIESNLGSAISKQSMRFANMEFARHLPQSMGSTINRSNDKIISLMRLFAIARSNEADMKGLHGSRLTNFLSSNIHYGPYSAGDFAVKGRMMIAYLANIKPYNGQFYTRDQFANTFYKDNRSEGYSIFDNIQENMYGAFEIGADGMLGIKDKYKDIVSNEMIMNASSAMNVLARKLDGTMSGAEKTRMHNDAFAQALLLHRGWLLNAISERFHSKIYDYEKQMLISGMYSKENVSTAFRMMAMFIGQKVSDARHLNLKGLASKKFGSIEDRFESGQVYQAKRIIRELGMLATLAIITTILGRIVPLEGDDPSKAKKDEDTWQMWAYVLSLRSAMEFFALYSPGDVYGIVGNPTAAEGSLNNISDIFGMVFDGTYDDVIESGRYKYKTKLHRSVIKSIPGYKQFYENFISPDLGAIEKFTLDNLPGTFGLFNKVVNPDSEAEKRAKELKKIKLDIRKAREEARKRAGLRD